MVDWDLLGSIAEVIGGIGVILSLIYLSIQIKGSNRIASANSRQSMSEFAMNISKFRAEHADRYAKIDSSDALSEGDKIFQFWSHMQMLVYGETHFHQYQLGLMPEAHWIGFSSWLENYVESNGFSEFWNEEASSFSEDYRSWIDKVLEAKRK